MLNTSNTALVVLDVQGKLAKIVNENEKLEKNLKIMIEGSKILELPIFWFEQVPDKLGPTLDSLKELIDDKKPYVKDTFSCCGKEDFVKDIQSSGVSQVLLVGIETHVCVYQTARDLLNLGFDVHLVQDAVSSRTESNKQIGIEKIKLMGGTITSTEMCLFELLEVAKGDKFKAISKLVK